MKKIIVIIILLFCVTFAGAASEGKWLIFWFNINATTNDKTTVRDAIWSKFNDNRKLTLSSFSNSIYRVAANTNIKGYVIVFNEANLEMLDVDLSNMTAEVWNTWKSNNLETPNQLRVARGDNWKKTLGDNGLVKDE